MPKGHPISVPRVPWHEDKPLRFTIEAETMQAACRAYQKQGGCCGQGCSRCMRKAAHGD